MTLTTLLCSRSKKAIDEQQKARGPRCRVEVCVLDVSIEDQVYEVVGAGAERFGRLDYVVNAAGIAMDTRAEQPLREPRIEDGSWTSTSSGRSSCFVQQLRSCSSQSQFDLPSMGGRYNEARSSTSPPSKAWSESRYRQQTLQASPACPVHQDCLERLRQRWHSYQCNLSRIHCDPNDNQASVGTAGNVRARGKRSADAAHGKTSGNSRRRCLSQWRQGPFRRSCRTECRWWYTAR